MQISKYLHKIKSGEAINFDNFKKQIHKHGIDDQALFEIFETELKSRSSYWVKVLDQERFAQLLIFQNMSLRIEYPLLKRVIVISIQ